MYSLAKKQEFEKAGIIKKKIIALKHIQDISLVKDDYKVYKDVNMARIEAYDIAHYRGKNMIGVMTVIQGGETNKNEYRQFKIKTLDNANDPMALKEVLSRRLTHTEWILPEVIVVDGNNIQKNIAEKTLKQNNLMIPVVAVVKDEHHKVSRIIAPKNLLEKFESDILLANAEAHRFSINLHRKSARKNLIK